jgi:peroxiredoxin
MAQLEPMKGELEQAGTQLVFIAAEKRDGIFKPVKFLEKHPLVFPFLLDEDRTVTKGYGLYHWLAIDAINIAHPATLVVDGGGTVRYIYVGDSQMDRAPMEPVLDAVRKLSNSDGRLPNLNQEKAER